MVAESDMENAADIIDIIDNVPELTTAPDGRWLDSRKKHLMDYNRGRNYNWMLQNIFPRLRRTCAVIVFEDEPKAEVTVETPLPVVETPVTLPEHCFETPKVREDLPHEEVAEAEHSLPELQVIEDAPAEDTPVEETPAEETQIEETPVEETSAEETPVEFRTFEVCDYHHVFAFRSNLLLPLLNVGAELPIDNRWSVGVDYYYPWSWRRRNNKNCFELLFIAAEARYWFGERTLYNRLKGHSIGAYGAWGYYDFERNYHGTQGHGWSFGVDYLYSLPVAKDNLHFEFEIALGGIISRGAQPYNVREVGGRLIREKGVKKNFGYWGPTKVSVSLVIPINKCVKKTVTEP